MTDTVGFYSRQVVFLTGATGGLGGCLLYKLVVKLKVPKIYVLIRTSSDVARQRWMSTMSGQASEMLDTGAIHLVKGDMTRPSFGLSPDLIAEMEQQVTIVINAAANISFKASLRQVTQDNALSALEVARMSSRFARLTSHVQLSSAFATSFLPDGRVEERIYAVPNAEEILEGILSGRITESKEYCWPYARSKHIMECLLSTRYPRLPLLIVRPSAIGPAIREPCELYGPAGSIPLNSFYSRLMYPVSGPSVFHATEGSASGTNILDEIPVDLAANIVLQHAQRGNIGVVHAVSGSYVPRTLDQQITDVQTWVPEDWRSKLTKVIFTSDRTARQCALAEFYVISSRDWRYDNDRSRQLDVAGPLAMGLAEHDPERFTERRLTAIFAETKGLLEEKARKRQVKGKKTSSKI